MNLRELIKEELGKQLNKSLILKEDVKISEVLQYHIDNGMTLSENAFRVYSEGYFDFINEVRDLWNKGQINLNDEDILMIESDLGKKVKIGKTYIYLDAPYIYETETGKDTLTESKSPKKSNKFAVYTKNKTGEIKKVSFGNSILKESRKCSEKTDRTTAGYWSCNVNRHYGQLGLPLSKV
jgi:hypothetical protein